MFSRLNRRLFLLHERGCLELFKNPILPFLYVNLTDILKKSKRNAVLNGCFPYI